MTYNILYNVTHIQQTSPMLCWSAAVSMMLGSNLTAGPGGASLDTAGGLRAPFDNVQALAGSYGLSVAPPASWTVDRIALYMSRGPIVMLGIMPRRHAIVISGLVGDGSPGTLTYVNDPFRPTGPQSYPYGGLMTGAAFNLPAGTAWAPSEYILYR